MADENNLTETVLGSFDIRAKDFLGMFGELCTTEDKYERMKSVEVGYEKKGDSLSIVFSDKNCKCVLKKADLKGEDFSISTHGSCVIDCLLKAVSEDDMITVKFTDYCTYFTTPCGIIEKTNFSPLKKESLPDFPELSDTESGFKIGAKDLKEMINKTLFLKDLDSLIPFHPMLKGIFLEKEDENLKLVTTNGRKLAVACRKADFSGAEFSSVYIERPGLSVLAHSLHDEDTVSVFVEGDYIFFKSEHFDLTDHLYQGTFPDYRRVIPQQQSQKVVVQKEKLLSFVKLADIVLSQISDDDFESHYDEKVDEYYDEFIPETAHRIYFTFSKNSLTLKIDKYVSAKMVIPCEYSGEDIEANFDYFCLKNIFKTFDSEHIVINFTSDQGAFIFQNEGNEKDLQLILPMKKQEKASE